MLSLSFLYTETKRPDGKDAEVAVVDEEAILNLLENSQTFLPLSQNSNQSAILGSKSFKADIILKMHYLYFFMFLCIFLVLSNWLIMINWFNDIFI